MITRPTNGSKDIHFLDQAGQEGKDLITSLTNALSCKYAMLPNCLCPQLVGRAAAEPALGLRAWPSDSPIAAGRARHCCHYAPRFIFEANTMHTLHVQLILALRSCNSSCNYSNIVLLLYFHFFQIALCTLLPKKLQPTHSKLGRVHRVTFGLAF